MSEGNDNESSSEKFAKLHAVSMGQVDQVIRGNVQSLGTHLSNVLGVYRNIIEFQSMELCLQRELELLLRNHDKEPTSDYPTNEVAIVLSKIQELRKEVAAINKAAADKAKGGNNGNA